jgi:hypothetical protein
LTERYRETFTTQQIGWWFDCDFDDGDYGCGKSSGQSEIFRVSI